MKWLQLKLQMLPIIAVEINNAIAKYIQLVEEIDEYSLQNPDKKSTKVKQNGNADHDEEKYKLMVTYSQHRASCKARMEELKQFYMENCDDEKIHFFEKLRLKLKKIMQLKPKFNDKKGAIKRR